ncbi:MAG: hypothetical protein IKM26_03965 [Clostridia bacterium]|nr:hypothetical protein [Clostridia bacterium]
MQDVFIIDYFWILATGFKWIEQKENEGGGEDVRGAAFKVKAPLELPRKPVFWLDCYGRLYEKDSGHRMEKQAFPSLPGSFSSPFHGRDHALRDRPADCLCGCAPGGPPFCCGKTSGFHYLAAAAAYSPARFCRSKNGELKRIPYQSGSPQGVPCGFAKQTEKGENDERGELARIRLRFPFFN